MTDGLFILTNPIVSTSELAFMNSWSWYNEPFWPVDNAPVSEVDVNNPVDPITGNPFWQSYTIRILTKTAFLKRFAPSPIDTSTDIAFWVRGRYPTNADGTV